MKLVTVTAEGDTLVHCEGVISDYLTLCGLGEEPPLITRHETLIGSKIDCPDCKRIVQAAKQYRARNFRVWP